MLQEIVQLECSHLYFPPRTGKGHQRKGYASKSEEKSEEGSGDCPFCKSEPTGNRNQKHEERKCYPSPSYLPPKSSKSLTHYLGGIWGVCILRPNVGDLFALAQVVQCLNDGLACQRL